MPDMDLQIPAFTRIGMSCATQSRIAASVLDELRGAKTCEACDKAEPLDIAANSAPEAIH